METKRTTTGQPEVCSESKQDGHALNSVMTSLTLADRASGKKRTDYISWDDYFMSVAFLSAMRSKDPCSQVGACIVNTDKKVVGIGYNGMPSGCSDDLLPWGKHSLDPLSTKYMYVCHAEMNAIMNTNSSDLAGCCIYVALFPCNECAKLIIQAGIRRVIFLSDKHCQKPETIASKRLLDLAGVVFRQYYPTQKTIELNFPTDERDKLSSSTPVTPTKRDINKKRNDYLAWGEYFMAMATLSSLRSKDPAIQVGACIVNADNRIVGIGYNGMPYGCSDELPWEESNSDKLQTKDMYMCHAVVNAILNKNCASVSGCIIYVAFFPCNECAKVIIQAKIKKIIYSSDKYKEQPATRAAKRMLDLAGITHCVYNLPQRKVVIDFTTIDWNNTSQV